MRHYATCFIVSALIPVLGGIVAWTLGLQWEEHSHGGSIPDDPDTNADLQNNNLGILHGTIAGLAIWTCIIVAEL